MPTLRICCSQPGICFQVILSQNAFHIEASLTPPVTFFAGALLVGSLLLARRLAWASVPETLGFRLRGGVLGNLFVGGFVAGPGTFARVLES